MNYYKEYKAMLSQNYFGKTDLFDNQDIKPKIDQLINRLSDKTLGKEKELKEILNIMSELSCYKAVLNMDTKFNEIPDSRHKQNKYLHARGAVSYEKGKRVWTGVYIGPVIELIDPKIKKNAMEKASVELFYKVLDKLKKAIAL